MELIILHGPPAVGKYTVAKQLQKQTGYRLLHIHAIYDFLEEIFGKQRYEISLQLLQHISLSVFEKAAEEKIDGLIFTYAQLASDDFRFVRILQDRLEKQKVNIRLVHLFCREEKLYQRVVKGSRKGFRKTTKWFETFDTISSHGFSRPRILTYDLQVLWILLQASA